MQLVPSNHKDNYRFIAIGIIIFFTLASIGIAILVGRATNTEIRQRLSERSQTIAAALHVEDVMALQGKPQDGETATYDALKTQLAAIKQANRDVRSIYLTGSHNGRLFFYVDSEQPDSPDYSPAAEWYDDATPEFKSMFQTAKPVVEGPVSDDFGTFISGLAPMFQPNSRTVAAVVGIDVAAATYWRDIILAAAVPVAIGLAFILVVLIFEGIRRRNLRLLALRSELVSVASHELHNPITGIRWASESLMKFINDPVKAAPMVKAIQRSAEQLEISTDEILELSHTMNRRALALAPTDMTQLVSQVLNTQELSAQQKEVRLLLDPSWTPGLTMNIDPEKMKRVLHNMVSNAIKYSSHATTVTIAYRQDEKYHYIVVSDQGIGIPLNEQSKVFKGFYRASNATKHNIPGTGLGLYLVKAVLEQHHGSVSFISEENQGSTFTLCLPRGKK